MPIFSAVNNLALPPDTLFKPSVEFPTYSPDYAFHFSPLSTIDANPTFIFDDGSQYPKYHGPSAPVIHEWTNPIEQKQYSVNFNEQHLRYRRLFLLRYLGIDDPKYYLCPWVVIPYEKPGPAGSYTPTIASFALQVKPFSIYESKPSSDIKKAIKNQNALRILTLAPSSGLITAAWDDHIASDSTKIAEQQCFRPREITVTVQPSSSAYNYQEYIDIKNSDNDTVGRIYILFVTMVEHKVIFFSADNPLASTPTAISRTLRIEMLGNTESSSFHPLSDLNSLYNRAGIKFSWENPSLTIQDEEPTNPDRPVSVGVPIDILAEDGIDFNKIVNLTSRVLGTAGGRLVGRIIPSENRSKYLFVFFSPWVWSAQTAASSTEGGKADLTGGISNTSKSISCVYENTVKTLCHEAAHALGAPHYFFETAMGVATTPAKTPAEIEAAVKELCRDAAGVLQDLKLGTKTAFYDFHDLMNGSDSCVKFEDRATLSQPKLDPGDTIVDWSQKKFADFYVDCSAVYSTYNLMDYQSRDAETQEYRPARQERLTKHQVEKLRYFITKTTQP